MRRFWSQNYDTAWYFGSQIDRKKPFLMLEQKRGKQVIGGHMPYGAHEFLGPCEYVTILRHPVDRVVSHYYSLQEFPSVGSTRIRKNLRLPLLEYLALPNPERIFPRNSQTLLLSGLTGKVQDAIDNLGKFKVFGLIDYLDLSLKRIAKAFDCPVTIDPKVKVNETMERPHLKDLTPAELAFIEEQEHKDMALFEWAYDNFTF